MKIACVICAGTVQEDYFVAAPCGHTFHHTCLDQWLVHQKSCPQCRERCLPRQTLRLFLDDTNTSSLMSQYDNLSANDLKEQLQEQDQLSKQKDEALRIAKQELESVREEIKAWKAQCDGTQFKIDKEKAISQSLKHQLQMLQNERDILQVKAQEIDILKEKIVKLQNIELLLKGNKEDAQEVVNSSPNNLSDYVMSLKREYDYIKERKAAMQKEKDKYFQEVTELKRKLRSTELELQMAKSNLNTVTSDLHSYEVEKDNLKKKVQFLEKALESPNSRTTFQRILESPMPEALAKKRKIETSTDESSPEDISLTTQQKEKENRQINMFTDKELTNSDEAPVLIPVQKMSARNSHSALSSGFNGFGGHSKVIISKGKQHPLQANKRPPLRFAPRSAATSNSTSSKNNLPIMSLKF